MANLKNVVIIGSGPAGYTAAIYAARADLKPILISGIQPGGQLTITTDVENYPGYENPIQGPWLMEQMQKQSLLVGTEIINNHVEKVELHGDIKKIYLDNGETINSKAVIICTGAQARWLNIENEKKLQGRGLSACATCDGFFFKDKVVAVIGGGNTAAEEALFLSKFATKVLIIHRRDKLRAEKILQERLNDNKKIDFLWNSEVKRYYGDSELTAIEILDNKKNYWLFTNKSNDQTDDYSNELYIYKIIGDFKKIIPHNAFGLQAMSIGYVVPEDAATIWRGPMVMSAIEQLLRDVDWQDLEILIIDMPPGLATIVFSFLFASITVMLRFSKARITKGVNPYTEKNAIVIAIIAGIISCSNYLTFST